MCSSLPGGGVWLIDNDSIAGINAYGVFAMYEAYHSADVTCIIPAPLIIRELG